MIIPECSAGTLQTFDRFASPSCRELWMQLLKGLKGLFFGVLSYRIHVWYVCLHKNQPNVGVYTIHGSYGYSAVKGFFLQQKKI